MILVTSAAGGVGRPLVRQLVADGHPVRAFVKNDEQARRSREDGATETVIGDLRRPGDLENALRGARQIYHAAPTQLIDERPVAERLIAAAAAEKLEHVVFHSVIHPDIAELPHHRQKLEVEGLLRDSDLPVTVLRPSHYMQNVLDFWAFFSSGLLPYPTSPQSRMGVVDVEDVAEAIKLLLFTEERMNRAPKTSMFDLNDDDAELGLTHFGQSLSGLDEMPDVPPEDDDDDDPGTYTYTASEDEYIFCVAVCAYREPCQQHVLLEITELDRDQNVS